MSRMPPSLSGSLLCANAAVADIASAAAKTPVTTFFMKASLMPAALLAALNFCRRNHAAWHHERQPIAISAKRNDRHDGSAQTRWVERSDTHQCRCARRWVSLRSTHPAHSDE